MKYVVKVAVKLVMWFFALFVLLVLGGFWLAFYSIGIVDPARTPENEVKGIAYFIWHFKIKEKEE